MSPKTFDESFMAALAIFGAFGQASADIGR